jgi:prolyl oligopeptidase
VNSPTDFKYIYKADVHVHVKDGRAICGHGCHRLNDPRVLDWTVARMMTFLAAATSSGKPVLLRLDYDVGEGIGSERTQKKKGAGEWAFLPRSCATPSIKC